MSYKIVHACIVKVKVTFAIRIIQGYVSLMSRLHPLSDLVHNSCVIEGKVTSTFKSVYKVVWTIKVKKSEDTKGAIGIVNRRRTDNTMAKR